MRSFLFRSDGLESIARLIAARLPPLDGEWLAVPVPLHRRRLWRRGFNQSALLAREMARDPLVLLAAQPTRGIDVGATEFIHGEFLKLRSEGGAVLLISEDLEELFQLSDRIAVMFRGRIVADLPVEEASVERVGLLMAGVEEKAA